MSEQIITALGIDPGWAKSGLGALNLMPDGQIQPGGARIVRTSKSKEAQSRNLRIAMDDERRHHEFYDAFCQAIEDVKPQIVGIENYTIFNPKEYEHLRNIATALLAFLGLNQKGDKLPFSSPDEFVRAFTDPGIFGSFFEHLLGLKSAVDAFTVKRGQGAAAKTYGVYVAAMCACYRYNVPVFVFMAGDRGHRIVKKPKASKKDVEDALCRLVPGLRENVDTAIKAKGMRNHAYDGAAFAYLALLEHQKWSQDSFAKGAMT